MSRRGQTPDERLMLKFYEIATRQGDLASPVNIRFAAQQLGQKDTALKNIVKHLAQANFLKKIDESTICLTKNGCSFVEDILAEFD